jgi:hypothetical protein
VDWGKKSLKKRRSEAEHLKREAASQAGQGEAEDANLRRPTKGHPGADDFRSRL